MIESSTTATTVNGPCGESVEIAVEIVIVNYLYLHYGHKYQ